jgi:hypothetical protein
MCLLEIEDLRTFVAALISLSGQEPVDFTSEARFSSVSVARDIRVRRCIAKILYRCMIIPLERMFDAETLHELP